MAPAERSVARLRRLLAEVAAERAALDRLAVDLEASRARPDARERPWIAVLAVDVHGYYTCVESIFERVARVFDGDVPSGSEWHKDLLAQMTIEVPSAPIFARGTGCKGFSRPVTVAASDRQPFSTGRTPLRRLVAFGVLTGRGGYSDG